MSEAGAGLFYPDSPEDDERILMMDRPAAELTPDAMRAVMDAVWRGDR